MDKKISVIIPIYNSAKTLNRTLDSVINQNYKNLEIILVNDGSTDNSIEICTEYAKKDNRIIIVNQKNKGVSEARNYGINISTGYFIAFVDSDDTLQNNYFEELYNNIKLFNSDIVVTNVKCIMDNNNFFPYKNENLLKEYSKENFLKLVLNFKIGNAVWGKLFKRDCIYDLKFKNFKINEDFIFFWDAIKKANNFSINFNTHYNYYINTNDSLTKKKFTKENMSMIEHIDKVIKDVNLDYPNLNEDAINYYNACLLHNLMLYYDYLCSDVNDEFYIEEIKEMISRAKGIKKIDNRFLVSEQDVNIKSLLNAIQDKIKRGVK